MKALLLFCLLGTSAMLAADEHPTPAAVATSSQGSLYSFDSTWTNQLGKKVAWKESTGTTRIVALGYATCKGICPRVIGDMQRIEKELTDGEKEKCRFTFVSVDPEHDKVAELKALGERHKIEDARWDLLTGDPESVLELAVALGVRYDWLAHYLFDSIDEVQDYATRWLWTYNHERPNMALGGITPKQKLALAA